MPINFKTLLKTPPCWLRPVPGGDDVILTTVARVVRNLPGFRFPGWSTAEERAAVAAEILPVLRSYPRFRYCYRAEMPELGLEQRRILLERKQITPGMAARQDGCHLLISRDQELFAMVNEEEHLCLHVAVPGFAVRDLLETVEDVSLHLENKLSFARNEHGAYLTSMPQEAGEGLQLFAMLHLPALSMSGSMDKVRNALEKMHLNIASFCAEADDCGNLYVVYTQTLEQKTSAEELAHFAHICTALATKEQRMQDLEFERKDGPDPLDLIYRSYGMLRYAFSLEYKELLSALSLIRLGLSHHLLLAGQAGEKTPAVPAEILRLYELSPAALRFSNKQVKNARQAQGLRSDEVREALKSLTPLLS